MGLLDAQPCALAAGLDFALFGVVERPMGSMEKFIAKTSTLMIGLAALRSAVAFFNQETVLLLRDAPAVIKATDINILLIDRIISGGGTVADFLNCPFITLCSALLLHREPEFRHFIPRRIIIRPGGSGCAIS